MPAAALGGEVRRPGALHGARPPARADRRGDPRPRAAAHLRARPAERRAPRRSRARSRELGTVTRIAAADAPSTAVAFARFQDGAFGWGIVDPGHGFVFANPGRPGDAGAAAPLSASGHVRAAAASRRRRRAARARWPSYLLDVRPGYSSDPVRGVYNHGWIVGDPRAVGVAAQAAIDGLLEIAPVNARKP